MRNALLFVATLSLAVCAADTDTDTDQVSAEVAGTPDELALLRFLNARTTEVAELDDQVPLDARAAKNLIAHRDGPDGLSGSGDDNLFDSAAEVDAVPYVGPSAMDALIAYAVAGNWVNDDELFGTFDGVPFTVEESRAAVTLADTATVAKLKSIGLDSRAASGIVAARPITTMAQLAAVRYVGPASMQKIHAAVGAPSSCSDDAVTLQISTIIPGMLLLSESDYPLELVSYPNKGASAASAPQFLALLGLPASTPVRVGTFDQMMERFGYESDAAKVEALRAVFAQNLTNVVVYEVGTIQVHDYVIGVTACGGLVGVTAISIET
jgi:DNA uptake protein ComE-like DNA-binding protein